MTYAKVDAAVMQLNQSERGEAALTALYAFLDNYGWSLDLPNQRALHTIIDAFYHGDLDASEVLHAMRGYAERGVD